MSNIDGFADPNIIDQPYDFLSSLRSERPVYFSAALGAYVVSRSADARRVLQAPELFKSIPAYSEETGGNYNFAPEYNHLYDDAGVPRQVATLVITEGAEHRRYRDMVGSVFGISIVKKLTPNINEAALGLIDAFIDRGEADLHAEFCQQLPLIVMCDLLGWPRHNVDLLQRSASALGRLTAGGFETPETRIKLHKDQVEFHQYALTQLDRVRKEPDGSVLSHIVHTTPADGVPINDAEFCAMASILNIGGNETTVSGLGSMLYMLASDPDQQEALRQAPELIPKFVEEALRVETPVPFVFRWLYEDATVDGIDIPAGSTVMVSLASSNRDQDVVGDPTQMDLSRKGIRNHFSFGLGVHYCLGAMLARLELQIALERLLDRTRNIRIAPGASLRRENMITVRMLKSLPVVFTAAPKG